MTINFRSSATDGVIQYNGTDIVSFNATNIIYAQRNVPAFIGRLSSTQKMAAVGTVKVKIDSIEIDNTNSWDPVNYYFMPKVEGYYLVNGCITIWGGATSYAVIYKNGTVGVGGIYGDYKRTLTLSYSSNYTYNVNGVVYLNGTTDYVSLWGYNSQSLQFESWDPFLSGTKLSIFLLYS